MLSAVITKESHTPETPSMAQQTTAAGIRRTALRSRKMTGARLMTPLPGGSTKSRIYEISVRMIAYEERRGQR